MLNPNMEIEKHYFLIIYLKKFSLVYFSIFHVLVHYIDIFSLTINISMNNALDVASLMIKLIVARILGLYVCYKI